MQRRPTAMSQIEAIQHLTVHVQLMLRRSGIADSHRFGKAIAGQRVHGPFGQMACTVDPIHSSACCPADQRLPKEANRANRVPLRDIRRSTMRQEQNSRRATSNRNRANSSRRRALQAATSSARRASRRSARWINALSVIDKRDLIWPPRFGIVEPANPVEPEPLR